MNKIGYFIAVSDFIANNIKSVFKNSIVKTIINVPRDSFFKTPFLSKGELIKKLSLGNPYLHYIMYCGRFDKEKGLDILIDAFNKIANNSFCLLLVGKENETAFWLKSRNALPKNCIITGYIDNDCLPYYYDVASVVVIPSFRVNEANSVVAIEAIARNKKIVSSLTGALPEFSSFYKNIYFSKDCNSLPEAIIKAVNHPTFQYSKPCCSNAFEYTKDIRLFIKSVIDAK